MKIARTAIAAVLEHIGMPERVGRLEVFGRTETEWIDFLESNLYAHEDQVAALRRLAQARKEALPE